MSRRGQMQQHDIAIGLVVQDLVAAGFEVLEQVPDFVDAGRHRNWLLVAATPDGP